MLENFVIPQIQQRQRLDSNTIVQDRCTPHIGLCVQQFLRQHFSNDRVISDNLATSFSRTYSP